MTAENLGALVGLIEDGTISGKLAKDVFEVMLETGKAPARHLAPLNCPNRQVSAPWRYRCCTGDMYN